MKFADIIGEFIQKIGLEDTGTEQDGSVTLVFDELHEISFIPDHDDNALYLYCEIAQANTLGLSAYKFLMESSLLGAKTGGGCFSLEPRLDKLVFWKRFTDCFEDGNDLEGIVNQFLGQVIAWKDRLARLETEAAQQDATASGYKYEKGSFAGFA